MDILGKIDEGLYKVKETIANLLPQDVAEKIPIAGLSSARLHNEDIKTYVRRTLPTYDIDTIARTIQYSAKSPDEIREGLKLILAEGYRNLKKSPSQSEVKKTSDILRFIKSNNDFIKGVLGENYSFDNILKVYGKAKKDIVINQVIPEMRKQEAVEKAVNYLNLASLGLLMVPVAGAGIRLGASLLLKPVATKLAESVLFNTAMNVSATLGTTSAVGSIIGQVVESHGKGASAVPVLTDPFNMLFYSDIYYGSRVIGKTARDLASRTTPEDLINQAIYRTHTPLTEHRAQDLATRFLNIKKKVNVSNTTPTYKVLANMYDKDTLDTLHEAIKVHYEDVLDYKRIKPIEEKAIDKVLSTYFKETGLKNKIEDIEQLESIMKKLYYEGDKDIELAVKGSLSHRLVSFLNRSNGKIIINAGEDSFGLDAKALDSKLLSEAIDKITKNEVAVVELIPKGEEAPVKFGLRAFYMPSHDDFILIKTKQDSAMALPLYKLLDLQDTVKNLEGMGYEIEHIVLPEHKLFPVTIDKIKREIKKYAIKDAPDKITLADLMAERLEELKTLDKNGHFRRKGKGFILEFEDEKVAKEYYLTNRLSGYNIYRSYGILKKTLDILNAGKSLNEGQVFLKNFLKDVIKQKETTSLAKLNRKLAPLFTALSPQIGVSSHISDIQLISMLTPSFKYRLNTESLVKGLRDEFSRYALGEGIYTINKLNPFVMFFKGLTESVLMENLKNPNVIKELENSLKIPLSKMLEEDFEGTVKHMARVLSYETPLTLHPSLLKYDNARKVLDSITPWTEFIVGPSMLAIDGLKSGWNAKKVGKALGWTLGAGLVLGPQGVSLLMPPETIFNVLKNTTGMLSVLFGNDDIKIDHPDLTSWLLGTTKIKDLDPEEKINIYSSAGTVIRKHLEGLTITNSIEPVLDGLEKTLNFLSQLKYTGVISPSAGAIAPDIPTPVLKMIMNILADFKRNPTLDNFLDALLKDVKLLRNFYKSIEPSELARYPKEVVDTTIGALSFMHYLLFYYDKTLDNSMLNNLAALIKEKPNWTKTPTVDYIKTLSLRQYTDLLDYHQIKAEIDRLDEQNKIVYLKRINKMAGNIFKILKKQEGSYEERQKKVKALANAIKILTDYRPELKDGANEILKELYSMGYKINIWEE